jgi:hypothetical protein
MVLMQCLWNELDFECKSLTSATLFALSSTLQVTVVDTSSDIAVIKNNVGQDTFVCCLAFQTTGSEVTVSL